MKIIMEQNEIGKITVFGETIDYLIKGFINEHQFCELIKMAYETTLNGKDFKDEDIEDEKVLLIWKTLKHTYKKSVRNKRNYQERKTREFIDVETGEVIDDDDSFKNIVYRQKTEVKKENTDTPTTTPKIIKNIKLPENMEKMFNENKMMLGGIFRKDSTLPKSKKKERWENFCKEYGVEITEENLKMMNNRYKAYEESEYERVRNESEAQLNYEMANYSQL